MTKIIAPIEPITKQQIGRASDRFASRCEKNGVSLPKDTVQIVLEDEGDALAQEMFEALRLRVERRSEMLVRRVKVDRTKTPAEMIALLKRKEYINADVLATMPTDGPEEVDVYFFPLKRYVPVIEWQAELDARGLKIDPYAQIQVNIDDPSLADTHPNGSQWGLDEKKKQASFLTVDRWRGGRNVHVDRHVNGWRDGWWGVGVRKIGSQD